LVLMRIFSRRNDLGLHEKQDWTAGGALAFTLPRA